MCMYIPTYPTYSTYRYTRRTTRVVYVPQRVPVCYNFTVYIILLYTYCNYICFTVHVFDICVLVLLGRKELGSESGVMGRPDFLLDGRAKEKVTLNGNIAIVSYKLSQSSV